MKSDFNKRRKTMLKIEKTSIYGFEEAIRGMRNPMNSWNKSDSGINKGGDDGVSCSNCTDFDCQHTYDHYFQIGKNDFELMTKLRNAGTDHRKFMRMITLYCDITAPLYWWKEFDTYKVGTVANSCSTMHKIVEKEFTVEDFSHEHLTVQSLEVLRHTIQYLNMHRMVYLTTNTKPTANGTALSDDACAKLKKDIWWQMIQLLPSSYNQKRTVMLNYEVLANIYKSRHNHKMDEWHTLCDWLEGLPYSEIITGYEQHKKNSSKKY